ncbi:Alpha/Beta hydrolase protein [Mycena crocata]|nr:Alpha/Beta hydrolase protein [Mycena crocata]
MTEATRITITFLAAMVGETKYFTNDVHPNIEASEPSKNSSLTLAYRIFGDANPPRRLHSVLLFRLPPFCKNHFVVCGLPGGSESSSPFNVSAAQRGHTVPAVTYEDNIGLQHVLCAALGITVTKLEAYIEFSMGGQHAYHMATLSPDFVARIVVLAGSARTSWHNWSLLEGPKAALVNSADFHDVKYETPTTRGTRAFSRVYSTWALSQAWFRQRCWETLRSESLEECLRVLQTWQKGDITLFGPEEDRGDLPKALGRMKARVLLMPIRNDLYFLPEDSEEELKHLKIIESIWGHIAGGGNRTKENIKLQVRSFPEF